MMTYLERVDDSKNMRRFYILKITKTIFGSWALVRIWGRIGNQGGTRRESWFATQAEAEVPRLTIRQQRKRRGYCEIETY